MLQVRPSQRAASREATRVNILNAARRLFVTDGVDSVSMDGIASAASVARATIYQHFAGKTPLLEALLLEDWERQATLFAQLGDHGGRPKPAALTAWLRRVVKGMRQASGSFALHRVALGQNQDLVAAHEAHRQRLAAILRNVLIPTEVAANSTRARVEGAMIVAEIEYLATAALAEWTEEETDIAINIMAQRLVAMSTNR